MIRLHHCHQSRSMRSLWLLHEIGVPFDVQVHSFDKSLRSAEYLALNPAGRVPALEFDDEVICESGAIAEVLCEKFPQSGLGRALGDSERAAWLNWLHYAETISQHCAALTQQHVMLYDDTMRSPIIMKLEAARLAKTLDVVEAALVGRDYLLAGGFSAADIGIGHAIYMAQHFVKLNDLPALLRWFDRITSRKAFAESVPASGDAVLYTKPFYQAWDLPK